MKSEITSVGGQASCEYPVLKRSIPERCCGCDYVVLFTEPRKGVVVHVFESGASERVVLGWRGDMMGSPDCATFGEDNFALFNDTVQLSNS